MCKMDTSTIAPVTATTATVATTTCTNNSTISCNERLDSALALNNQGVELLLQNQDTEAVTCFTRALGMVKHVLLQPSSSSGSDDDYEEEQQGDSSDSNVDRYSDNLHSDIYAVPSFQTSAMNAGLGFVYTGAITLSSAAAAQATTAQTQGQDGGADAAAGISEAHMNVYSATIIYNIALVYHRQGVKYCKNICLEKAEKMYDMLLKLVGYSSSSGDPTSVMIDESLLPQAGTALLLRIAAINNCSLIKLDKGDYEFPRYGFHHLSRVLTTLNNDTARSLFDNLLISTDNNDPDDDSMSTDDDDDSPLSMDAVTTSSPSDQKNEDEEEVIQGMLLNVLLAKSPDAAPAA